MKPLIDIINLHPDHMDEVSDYEGIDENILEDTLPADVPSNLEVHTIMRLYSL